MQHVIVQRLIWRAVLTVALVGCAAMTAIVGIGRAQAALDVPQVLVYQGRLTDDDRITVPDGSYSMKFAIYNASSGGTCLWSAGDDDATASTIDCTANTPDASVSVTVTDGIFTVLLGDTSASMNALPDELFDDNGSSLYLGVTIGADAEMSPRRRIGSAAFALQAGDADLLDDLDTDSDGCTEACVPVTTANGNIVFTGDPQGTGVNQGTVYINPAAAGAGETIFGIADNGTSRFIVDTEGDVAIDGHLAVGDATRQDAHVINVAETFNAAASGVLSGVDLDIGFQGDLSTETGYGFRSQIEVEATVGTDRLANGYNVYAIDTYNGDGTTASWASYYSELLVNSGTITNARGAYHLTFVDGGTVTNAYGVHGRVEENSGTVTNGYAGYFIVENGVETAYGVVGTSNATGTTGYGGYFVADGATTDYAVYAAEGLVHIEGDSSPTVPSTVSGDGELYVNGTIETDGNIDSAGRLALVGTTPSAQNFISATESWTSASEHRGIDFDITATSAQSHSGIYIDLGGNGALNTGGRLRGVAANVGIDAGVGNDAQEIDQFLGTTTYSGTGITDSVRGLNTSATLAAAGTVTEYSALYARLTATNASAQITDAYGLNIELNPGNASITNDVYGSWIDIDNGTGSIDGDAYGYYADVSNATGAEYAIYTAGGYIHIEGQHLATTPTFNTVGNDGTVFIKGDTEVYEGSLCVGAGVADDCSDAAGTDGVIYSVNTSVTQHDLAEMFPSTQYLTAGEIVSVSDDSDEFVERTVGEEVIIGAISTAPGLTLGWETEADGFYPVALTGRAPVKVNGEGGAIAIGDRIAQSSVPGVGKKATEASEVVGIAMQAFDGVGQGAVITFIGPHYWDGVSGTSVTQEQASSQMNTGGVLVIENNQISNIASLQGQNWSVDESGTFQTSGSYQALIDGNQGNTQTAYATLSSQQLVTLAGTTQLSGKMANVQFADVDPAFANILDAAGGIVVTATMSNGSGTVSVRQKDANGFEIWRESGTGTQVDWIVMAYRRGEAPEDVDPEPEEEAEEPADQEIEEPAVNEQGTDPESVQQPAEEPSDQEVFEEGASAEPSDTQEPADQEIEEPAVNEEVADPDPVQEPVDEPDAEPETVQEPAEQEADPSEPAADTTSDSSETDGQEITE